MTKKKCLTSTAKKMKAASTSIESGFIGNRKRLRRRMKILSVFSTFKYKKTKEDVLISTHPLILCLFSLKNRKYLLHNLQSLRLYSIELNQIDAFGQSGNRDGLSSISRQSCRSHNLTGSSQHCSLSISLRIGQN